MITEKEIHDLIVKSKRSRRYMECDELLDELQSRAPNVRQLLNDNGILSHTKNVHPFLIQQGFARILIDNSNSSPVDIGVVFTADGVATLKNIVDYLNAMEMPHD